jgi:hypothetical protein
MTNEALALFCLTIRSRPVPGQLCRSHRPPPQQFAAGALFGAMSDVLLFALWPTCALMCGIVLRLDWGLQAPMHIAGLSGAAPRNHPNAVPPGFNHAPVPPFRQPTWTSGHMITHMTNP